MSSLSEILSSFIPESSYRADGDFKDQARNTSSPLTQFIVSIIIGSISLLGFSLLRLKWPTLYSSKSKLINAPPRKMSRKFFGWIMPLIKIQEKEILDSVGLDALIYIRFFKMSALIFGICTIYGAFVLIMITSFIKNDQKEEDGFDVTLRWSILIVPEESPFLIAHAVGVYLFSLVAMYFLHREYQIFAHLRWKFLLNARNSVTARSVIVEGIPPNLRSEKALIKYYNRIDIGEAETARICHSASELARLVSSRDSALRSLEKTVVSWIGNPCLESDYDPKKLKRAILNSEDLKIGDLPRPQARDGFLGLFGNKVDALNYYNKAIKDLDASIKLMRAKDSKYRTTSVGFITFKSIKSAHIASQIVPNSTPYRLRTKLAPEPRDIYWPNLGVTFQEKIFRQLIAYIAMIFVIFFYFIPLGFISPLLQLKALTKVFPFLEKLKDSKLIWDLLSGFLPTVATITFISITPLIFTGLSIIQGNKSISAIERHTVSKHYLFLFCNVLLVFTVSGSILKLLIENVINKPSEIPNLLASSLPSVAPFFVNYVMILGIGYFPLQLIQIGPVFSYFFRRIFSSTPRDFAELLTPSFIDYGWLLGQPLLVFTIIMTYSIVSPLILLVGTAYFTIGHFVNKYTLMYVSYRSYESGGLLWPMIFRRCMTGIFLNQILMTGYFGLVNMYPLSITLIPLLIATSLYSIYIPRAYPNGCKYLPADFLKGTDQMEESLLESCAIPESDVYSTVNEPDDENETAPLDSESLPIPEQRDLYKIGPISHSIAESDVPASLAAEACMDDQQFVAEPNLRTDYQESTSLRFKGILDSSISSYGNPAIHGTLSSLWLPQKIDRKAYNKAVGNRSCCFPNSVLTRDVQSPQSIDEETLIIPHSHESSEPLNSAN